MNQQLSNVDFGSMVSGQIQFEGNTQWCVPDQDWDSIDPDEAVIGGNLCNP